MFISTICSVFLVLVRWSLRVYLKRFKIVFLTHFYALFLWIFLIFSSYVFFFFFHLTHNLVLFRSVPISAGKFASCMFFVSQRSTLRCGRHSIRVWVPCDALRSAFRLRLRLRPEKLAAGWAAGSAVGSGRMPKSKWYRLPSMVNTFWQILLSLIPIQILMEREIRNAIKSIVLRHSKW